MEQSYGAQVLQRLSIPGLLALVLSIWLCARAVPWSTKASSNKRDAVLLGVRLAGVLVAVLGTLIMLDFIPGL